MQGRRKAIALISAASSGILLPKLSKAKNVKGSSNFRYCLNTSTISSQKPGLLKYIEIASKAGYDGVELWVRDIKAHLDAGNSADSLKKYHY